jgi:glycine cleavage system H protein
MRPNDRKYLPSHEWCKISDGIATVGITDWAVTHLNSLVFLDLPPKGTKVEHGKPFAEIESVKAVSDIYAPVSGEIVEVNETLPDSLETLDQDPWQAGWMIRVKVSGESPDLLDLKSYEQQLESAES